MHLWCLKKVSHISLFFFLFLYLFRCVCNIDCSQTNFNPLCASDGKSYDNACQIKEASCQKQEKIEVMSLGRCQGNSHNKTHFKECFQFLFREEKKKKQKRSRAGFLSRNCYISIRVLQFLLQSTGCGGRQSPLWCEAWWGQHSSPCPEQQGTAQPCSGLCSRHQALSARQQGWFFKWPLLGPMMPKMPGKVFSSGGLRLSLFFHKYSASLEPLHHL